jgi:hypothetical protein
MPSEPGHHVAHCVIVANASLTGRQLVAEGLSGFYSVSLTWQMSSVSPWVLLEGVIRFPGEVGDL